MRAGCVAPLVATTLASPATALQVWQRRPSALSTAGLAVIATLGVLFQHTAVAQSTTGAFVQGAAFSTGSRVSTITVTLTSPVGRGDLLVGWISQFDAPEQVQVTDNVNGTWTRAPGSMTFMSDTGDIALYRSEEHT